MKCTLCGPAHRFLLLAVAAGLLAVGSTRLLADDATRVVQVEEDWELVVLEPDSSTAGPQVTCMMSPITGEDGLHMTFELNHKSGAQFVPGGFTMQLWTGETWISTKRSDTSTLMSTPGETVKWTQSMKINGEHLTFEIKNGTSSTWGAFGDGSEKLKSSAPWGQDNINGYSPDTSVNLSGIGFASNRVHSLVLKKVRVHTASGQVYEDSTLRTVYEHQ